MVTSLNHPLISHKLSQLRDHTTSSSDFRRTLREISWLLAYESTRRLQTEKITISTPLEETQGERLPSPSPCIVSILRAGNGLLDGFLDIIPEAAVGFLGLARNHETLQPEKYYCKLPSQIEKRQVLLVDPMLATGGSTIASLDTLKNHGAQDIVFACLVAAPEGIARMQEAHPEVPIITAAKDRCLNDIGYILPGLGDAGDRIYNTGA